MHSYIGKYEISELIQSFRKAYIIEKVNTKDIDEYISSLFAVLRSRGVDTNIFTQAKVKKVIQNDKKYTYIILLIIRKDSNINSVAYENIKNALQSVVPCKTIQEWYRCKYT